MVVPPTPPRLQLNPFRRSRIAQAVSAIRSAGSWHVTVWSVLFIISIGATVKYGCEVSNLIDPLASKSQHDGPIRLGVYNWAGYYPLVVAQEKGFFKKHGLNIELVKAETIGELNDWLRNGVTQASVGVLTDFVVLQNLGTPIQMMVATDYSLADVVLGNPKLQSPRDLEGRRIGISELNSFAEYFVVRSLEMAGVNPRKVNFYTVPIDNVPKAILNGTIDAGHTWDPALSAGLRQGLKPILSSAQNPNFVISGLAFRSEITANGAIPLAITRSFFEALTLQKTDPVAFASIPAKYFEIAAEDAQRFIDENIKPIDLDENIRIYQKGGLLAQEARAITAFFGRRGLEIDPKDIDRLLNDSVVRRIEDDRAMSLRSKSKSKRKFSYRTIDKSLAAAGLEQ